MVSDSAKKLFDKGLTFFHRGEHKEAAEFFKKAILEEPDYSEALYNLSGCYSSIGQIDDALVYLARASKLNPKCLDWAREDGEFDAIRDHDVFKKILETNDPLFVAETPEQASSQDIQDGDNADGTGAIPIFEDGISQNPVQNFNSALPPCLQCGGIVEAETYIQYPVIMSFGFVFAGVIIALISFQWFSLLIGIPLICIGFYMFLQSKTEWICQVCGARGKAAGQPDDWKPAIKEQTNPQH